MAADLKQLLVKLGIGTADWKTAVKAIRSEISDVNKEAKATHAENVSQTKKEIALEKEKADTIIATVKHIEAQLNGYKGVLAQGKLNEEQLTKILDVAKNLTVEQDHYLKILKNVPEAHELDIQKMRQKLNISREEFALQENKMRLAAGAGVRNTAPGQAPPGAVTAGRVDKLQGQLATAQLRTSTAAVEGEMQANTAAYRAGELQLKEYVAKQTALLMQLHAKKLSLIEQETLRQTQAVRTLETLGKMSKAEADLEVKIINEKNRLIEASEKRRFEMQQRGISATSSKAKGPGLMGAVSNMAGFMMGGGLGVQMLAAVTAGNALYAVIGKIAEKLKEVVIGGGSEQILKFQFESLTQRAGVDSVQALGKLRQATRGWVDDAALFKTANTFMQSGIKASTDQMTDLIGNVVKLGRVNNRDATQSTQALTQAFLSGRMQILARVTGIKELRTATRGLGQAQDSASRSTAEFNKISALVAARAKATPESPETLAETLKRSSIATKNFYDDLAGGIAKSRGFREFLLTIVDGIERFVKWSSKAAEVIGEVLGPVFSVFGGVLSLVAAVWNEIGTVLKVVFGPIIEDAVAIVKLAQSLTGLGGSIVKSIGHLFSLKGALLTVTQILTMLTFGFKETGRAVELLGALSDAYSHGSLNEAKIAWQKFKDQTSADTTEMLDKLAGLESQKTAKPEDKKGEAAPKLPPPDPDPREAQARARALMQRNRALAKEQLEIARDRIEKEKELVDRQYKEGEITQGQFIAARKQQEGQLLAAKILEFNQETDARRKQLAEQLKEQKVWGAAAKLQFEAFDIETRTRSDALWREYYKTINGLDSQSIADITSARKKYLATARELEKGEFAEKKKLLDEDFKNGLVSANQYLNTRKEQIQQEHDFAIREAADQYAYAEKNETSLADYKAQLAKAEQQREHDLTELKRKELDTRLQAIKERYSEAQGYLQSLSGLVSEGPGVARAAGVSQTQVVGAQYDINEKRLELLHKEMADLNQLQAQGQISSDEYLHNWMKISGEINQAYLEHVKLNMEMAKAKDYLTPLGNIFSKLASTFGSLNKTFQESFARAGSVLEEIGKYKTTTGAQPGSSGNPLKDMLSNFKGLFKGQSTTAKSAQQRAQEMMDKMTQKVGGAVGAVEQFRQRMLITGTTVQNGFDRAITQLNNPTQTTASYIVTLGEAATNAARKLEQIGTSQTPTENLTPQQQQTSGVIGSQVAGAEQAVPIESSSGGTGTGAPGDLSQLPLSKTTDLMNNWNESLEKGVHTGSNFAGKLGTFANGLGAAVGGISNFIGAMQGAHSTGGGILSGAMSGMSAGATFGPIGMAVGGVGGAIMGGIFGSKQAAVDKQVKKIQSAAENIQKALTAGAIQMSTAIAELEQERQVAIQTLGSSKKGKKQLPSVLSGIDQQLDSLRQQQRKLLDDLHKGIAEMATPIPFQEFANSMDQIIEKYHQFADAAAGSAEEMANANKWLVESFQQYATTQKQDLNKAELDAVNNSIQLIDLQQQRVELQRQMNQAVADERTQIADVMAQGNAVRQRTAAMTKMQQVFQIQQQFGFTMTDLNTQKQNLDAQIAVSQDKLDKEKQIFNLATTRLDLENQSVKLQEAQTTLEIQATQMLANVVAKLAQLDIGQLTNLPNLLQQFGYQGYTPMQTSYTPAYSGMSPEGYTNPIFTSPVQYPTFTAGVTATSDLPVYKLGTDYVPKTGPAILHQGEQVVSVEDRIQQTIAKTKSPVISASLTIENKIHSMALARAGVEMLVIKAKDASRVKDIEHLDKLNTLVSNLRSASPNGMLSSDLENMLAKLYNVRGRYGSGGFTKEVL